MESQGQPCLKGLPSQPLGATTGQNDQDQENIPTSKKRVLEQTCLPQSKKQKNEGSVSTRVEKSNSIPRVLLDGDEDDETEEGDQLQRNLDETPEHFSESDDHPEELRNTTTTSLNQCETEGELVQHEDKPFNNDKTSCHEEECQREATSSVKVAVSSSYHGDISKEEDPINLLEEKTSTQNATESNPSSSTEQATICQDFQGHSTSDEVNIGLTYNNLSNKEVDANYQIQGHDHLDRDDRKNKVHMKLDMDNIQLLSVGGDYIDGLPSIVAVTSPNPDSVIGCHGDGVVQQADTGKGEAQNQSPAQSTIILNSSSNNQKSNDLDTMPIHVYPQGQGISLVTSSGILTADISTFSTQVPTILTEGDADENETHTNFSEQFHVVTTSNGLAGTPHIPGQTNEMLSVMMSSSDLSKSVILTADQQKAILGEVINPGVAGGQTLHITIPHVTTSGHQTIAATQGSEGNVPCGDQEGVDGQVRAIQVQLLSTNEVSMDKGTGEEGSGKNSSCHHQDCGKVCHRANKLKMHLVSQSGDRPYKCPHEGCEWAFATAYKLKRHERGHTGERPFVCPYEDCGRRFTTAYNLKTHVRAHNIPHIPCQYEGCDKSFPTLHKFRVHERRHQQEEKPFRCEVDGCGKEFSAMGTLASHLKSHSGERPHGCPMEGCDKRFTKASKLKLHLRTHTGERPFACDVEGCGWSFTSAYKLKRHMRKHTGERPFVCAYEGCHKSFTRSSHLKTHTLVHTGEKPYVCPIDGCNKAFTAGSSLNVHMRKHTGEKPFRCEEDGCTKAYTTASNLRAHQKRHDKNPKILEGSDDQQPLPSEYVTVNAMSGASNASSLVDNDSEVTYTGMHTFSSEDFTNDDVTTIPVSVHFPPGSLNAIVTNTGNPLTFSTAGTQDHSDVTDEQGKGTVATVTLPVSNMEVDGSHIDVAEFVVRSDNVEPVLQHHEVSKHSDVDTLKHDGGFDLSITSIVNQLRSHETSPTTKLGSNDVLATHRGERLVIDSKFVPSHSRALEFRTPVNPEDQFKPPAVIFQEDKSGSSDTEGEMSQVHSDLPTTNQGLMQITLPQEVIQIHFPPTNSPVPPVPSENETTIEMETTAGHHQLQAFESSSLSELQAHNLNKTQLSPYMEEESPDDSQVDNYPESTINLQDLR